MKLVGLLAFCCFTTLLFAQRGLIHYSRENGLVSNEIRDIVLDKSGFIWIATSKGIDRFDGQVFKHFRHIPADSKTILSNDIKKLSFDGNQSIWAATYNKGLIQFNTTSLNHKTFNRNNVSNFPSNTISELLSSPDTIWMTDFNGFFFSFNLKSKHVSRYKIPVLSKELPPQINFIKQDQVLKKFIWIGTSEGLFRFDKALKKWKQFLFSGATNFTNAAIKYYPNHFTCMTQMSKGTMLIGTSYGSLLYFDPYQGIFKLIKQQLSTFEDTPISSIEWLDSRYTYLCMLGKGLCLYDTWKKSYIAFQQPVQPDFSPQKIVRIDNQIVVSTKNSGFYTQDNSIIYGKEIFMQNPCVSMQISRDHKTGYFLEKSEYYQLSNSNNKTVIPLKELTNPVLFHLNANNSFVLIDQSNFIHLDSKGNKRIKAHQLAIQTAEMMGDSLICIATKDHHFYLIRSVDFSIIHKSVIQNLSTKYKQPEDFHPLISANNKRLLISCFDQVYQFDFSSNQLIPVPIFNREDSDLITALNSTQNSIWIGTKASGVWEYNLQSKKSSNFFTEEVGVQNEAILQVTFDQQSRLWVLASDKLIVHNFKTNRLHHLGIQNGLDQVKQIFAAGEYIYFLKEKSYVSSYTKSQLPKNQIATPYLLQIHLLNKAKQISTNRHYFNYTENSLIFEYGVKDFSNKEGVLVSYRLLGLDNKWKSGNLKNEAIYYNLASGSYVFQIKVNNLDQESILEYSFHISEPFWKSFWFYLSIAIIVVLSAWLYMKNRINRIKKEEQVKATFDAKIAQLESKALRAQMNPHFIFNCLNSIRLFILKNEVDNAADFIAKFSKLLRMILNHSRQDLIPVYDEIQSLKLYLEFERLRFGEDFDFDLQIDGQQVLDFQIPPMIIQPFIENAIWHGLMPKKGGNGKIRVSFQKQMSGLYIMIEDNGVGRDLAKLNNRKRSLKEGSVGLQITKERLESLSMLSKRQNYFEIEDLFDKNGNPTGTLVTLYFENIN